MGNYFCINCCYEKNNRINKPNNNINKPNNNINKPNNHINNNINFQKIINIKKFIKTNKSKHLYKTSPGKPIFILE
jgi:hypothetical protein